MKKGFTLIEILIVIAIIAILASIVIVAVNPARQLAQARNAQRRADSLTILNAVYQRYIDNGSLPTGITTSPLQLGASTSGDCARTCGNWSTGANCLNLSSDLVTTYIMAIPIDPKAGNDVAHTGYAIEKSDTDNRLTVRACDSELDITIEVRR